MNDSTRPLSRHADDLAALIGCGQQGNTVTACEEVTARLQAADRDAKLGVDTTELRQHAKRISEAHLAELDARRRP